ncbi:patched domain-containing protein 2 [Notothenia coriiceps]|uniref:Patched domain-containing protein 2 n=1 Tax=Notothenia coriiceps TaxID=8208 RepID=A0A6I9Q3M2_9TELE|nr:PREDICTED: patched domain-containing protein 2 [Notothenia coriiceps]
MDVEDEPLLFQTSWGGEEDEDEEEEDGVEHAAGWRCGLWRAVGWVYTQPWASGVVLGVVVSLPCALFAYMLLYCPPLDIDLSYSAFEVHSHFSAERFDALAIAVRTQLGSWDRRRRDVEDSESEALMELLLERLRGQEVFNRTDNEGVTSPAPQKALLQAAEDQRRGSAVSTDKSTVLDMGQDETGKHKDSNQTAEEEAERSQDGNTTLPLIRRRRFAPNYYLQSQAQWRIELVFVAQGEGDLNIFTPERLQTIRHVERLLMQHPQFHQFCWKPLEMLRDLPLGPSYCSPPSSLLSYLYPSERGGKIYYDGMGPDLADIQGSLSLAITHPQFYWYVDESLSPERLSSSLLRSELHFGAPLPSFYSLQDRAHEQRSRFKNFVVQYADILAEQSTSQVKVLYGGTELFDDEVRHTFHNDMMLAVISGACITVLVYVLTSFSVFLTFFGLASIGLSCLMALFLYHVVFGVRYLGILNGVAAFVIIGIGVDDVFVFISTFRQASHLRQPQQRMIYTIKTAGRATFLTSFTTAAAYAANTFSQIPAVHDFGLFMALIVSCCWLWVSALMPAALCIWTEVVEPREHAWLNCWKLFSGLSASHSPLSDEDDDVALLSVEMEPGSCDTDGDASILSLSVETPPFAPGQQHVGVVSTNLRWALKHLAAEPAVERRKAVLGVFLLVLLLSAGCCCFLRPATHAPLLFRRDTNLQTLLALRSNLSGQGISCPMCSGVFMEKPHPLYTHSNKLSSVLPLLHPECLSLPQPNLLPGQLSHGAVGLHGGKVRWLSMAFESTTYKGKSSFQTYSDFLQWENFIQEQLASLPQSSALQRGFQTCEHWKQIFMEIIGVESALWSLLLSLVICVAAVSVFTAHPLLLLPVLVTIVGVICLVVAIMYWLGWEMGAVEAISLSILVGSSVDYCLHLVEGYLLAGETMTSTPGHNSEPGVERQRRTLEAVNHVGVAIVSSAVTTVISTVPLFFCVIVPFAKFGQIVAINTAVSILFTLTVTVAMLAWMAPPRFNRTPRAVLKASLAVTVVSVLGAFICWVGGQFGALAWQPIST